MKQLIKYCTLFCTYGSVYFAIECIYKGRVTDYRMFLLAGCIGVLLGMVNNLFSFKTDFILQCLVGTLIATLCEAVGGYYWNIECGLGIWNYSSLPFSFVGGQVNLFFSIAWMFLSGILIVLDDVLRWKLYKEERPRYYIRDKLIFQVKKKNNGKI